MEAIRQAMNIPLFAIISIVIVALIYLFLSWFRIYSTRYNLSESRSRMISTVVVGLLVIQIIFMFILLNPVYNGIFILVSCFLGYTVLRNIIAGILLQATDTFESNEEYKVGQHRGVLTKVKLLGIELEENNKNIFVPYSLVTQKGMQKSKYNSMVKISVKGMLPKEESNDVLRTLENKILMLPYIKSDKPYRIKQDNSIATFQLWLDQKSYEKPFIKFLENNHIVIINENNHGGN